MKFELNWSSKLRDNTGRKKNLACRGMISGPQNLIPRSRNSWKSTSLKSTSFSKPTYRQREPFLALLYTIISSPLLVTNFILKIIVLSDKQQCPLPLTTSFSLTLVQTLQQSHSSSIVPYSQSGSTQFISSQSMQMVPSQL